MIRSCRLSETVFSKDGFMPRLPIVPRHYWPLVLASLLAGCTPTEAPQTDQAAARPAARAATGRDGTTSSESPRTAVRHNEPASPPDAGAAGPAAGNSKPSTKAPAQNTAEATPNDTDEASPAPDEWSLEEAQRRHARGKRQLVPVQFEEQKLLDAGLRKLVGRHIVIYTDLPPSPAVDELPKAFDAAVPQWAQYFDLDLAETEDWNVIAFVMEQKERFVDLGLLPDFLPPFGNGYSVGKVLWLYEQPSDYYRRHLLLHEGVHAFMRYAFGDCGPPWYMEGMAELLATHQWQDGTLVVPYFPQSREEAPMWGRVKILRDALAEDAALDWEAVFALPPTAHRQVDAYGWSWAACVLLEQDPRFHKRFRQVPSLLGLPGFQDSFREMFADDWDDICRQWRVFVAWCDYGYDIPREAVDFTPGEPLPEEGATITVSAERGWQNSGYRLQAAQAYRLTATGRFQIAADPTPWPCEPNGVTIRYFRGYPLGMLLAAVHDDQFAPEGLWQPVPVGLERTLVTERSGTLFLRVNDSPAEWRNNQGELEVHIEALLGNGS